MNRTNFKTALMALLLMSCAGLDRSCSSFCAGSLGADWIVVELTEDDGVPYRCWELRNVSISNEPQSDGIYWKNNHGNLVHIAGSYDRVQVYSGQWEKGFAEINMTRAACAEVNARRFDTKTGVYLNPDSDTAQE